MNSNYLKELSKESLKEAFNYDLSEFSVDNLLDSKVLENLGLIYCIVYNYDGVVTDYTSNVKFDIDNIIEARLFNEKWEIRIFNEEGNITGTVFKEMDNSRKIEKKYFLYPRNVESRNICRYACELKVNKYLNYDDENQAYIDYVKPCELIFTGGENDEANSSKKD